MYALHSHIFFTTVYSAGRTYRHSVLPSPLSLPFRYTSSFPFGHTHAYTLESGPAGARGSSMSADDRQGRRVCPGLNWVRVISCGMSTNSLCPPLLLQAYRPLQQIE